MMSEDKMRIVIDNKIDELIKKGYLEKIGNKYQLTPAGRKHHQKLLSRCNR